MAKKDLEDDDVVPGADDIDDVVPGADDIDDVVPGDDDIDEDALEDDIDDLALEDDLDVDLDGALPADGLAVDSLELDDLTGAPVAAAIDTTLVPVVDGDDDDAPEVEEALHPDDVETPLDTLLQERIAAITIDDEEEDLEEDEPADDDRGEGPTKIVPRRPGEFLCSSCFLVLPRHQLAEEAGMLCRDCA